MKTLIRCDEVFDALTRGPFPSGSHDDRFVDAHLRACHDCRQLAEALRPAVDLFHESMPDRDADLPSFGGLLDQAVQSEPDFVEAHGAALPHRATSRRRMTPAMVALLTTGLLAVVLLLVDSIVGRSAGVRPQPTAWSDSSEPGQQIRLAALGIPLSCLPSHSASIDLNRIKPIQLALSPAQREDFVCCTRCHYSDGKAQRSASALQKVMIACAICHQGARAAPSAA